MKTMIKTLRRGLFVPLALILGSFTGYAQDFPGNLMLTLNKSYAPGDPIEVFVEYVKTDIDGPDITEYTWQVASLDEDGNIEESLFSQSFTGDPSGYYAIPEVVTSQTELDKSYAVYLSATTSLGQYTGLVDVFYIEDMGINMPDEVCCGSPIIGNIIREGASTVNYTGQIKVEECDQAGTIIPNQPPYYDSGVVPGMNFGDFNISSSGFPCNRYYKVSLTLTYSGQPARYVEKVFYLSNYTLETKEVFCCNDPVSAIGKLCTTDPNYVQYEWLLTPCNAQGVVSGSPIYTSGLLSTPLTGQTYFFNTSLNCASYYKMDLNYFDSGNTKIDSNSRIIYISPSISQPVVSGPASVCGTGTYCETSISGPNTQYNWEQYMYTPTNIGHYNFGGKSSCETVPAPSHFSSVRVRVTNEYGCLSPYSASYPVTNSLQNPDFYLQIQSLSATTFTVSATLAGPANGWDSLKIEQTATTPPYVGDINTMLSNGTWSNPTWPGNAATFNGYDATSSNNHGWNNAYINITFPGICILEKGEYYRITHYIYDPSCGLDSASKVFNQYGPVGSAKLAPGENEEVNHAGANSFKMYPNPVNGIVSFEYEVLENSTAMVIITDMMGKEIKTASLSSNPGITRIDLSGHDNGIYFVNLYENNRLVKTEKLIVNH